MKLLILILSVTTLKLSSAFAIEKFNFDGCSGAPDGQWSHCCYEHDLLYWRGGSREQRKTADSQLRQCVNESGGPGYIFYDFVRSMGAEHWGNAWADQNLKGPLSQFEESQIRNETELWESLNRPARFEFIISEEILFQDLSQIRNFEFLKEFNQVKNTDGYQRFLVEYKKATSRHPLTETWR